MIAKCKSPSAGRERIPERSVHANDVRAFGRLTAAYDITRYASAKLFWEIGRKTAALTRFLTSPAAAAAAAPNATCAALR
ncbi:catalase [Methylocella silvestris]|uniref:catalase n=1 Tax=Methylocella silvestris TaxID=199596 RepID=UPI001FE02020|nr:catalase [Methylocella silvestris]